LIIKFQENFRSEFLTKNDTFDRPVSSLIRLVGGTRNIILFCSNRKVAYTSIVYFLAMRFIFKEKSFIIMNQ